jgi:hypothetical protein
MPGGKAFKLGKDGADFRFDIDHARGNAGRVRNNVRLGTPHFG